MSERSKPATPAPPEYPVWEGQLPGRLRTRFGTAILGTRSYLGQNIVEADAAAIVRLLEYLKAEEGFDTLLDLTAVDDPRRPERFEILYFLHRFRDNERLRVKIRLAEGAGAASVTGVFAGANWLEREVFDLFGVRFSGHPDLKRILLPEDWTGHPLRKDVSVLAMDQGWVREHLGIESGQ
jgi:NADH-quinone oxidoreductase subunit C